MFKKFLFTSSLIGLLASFSQHSFAQIYIPDGKYLLSEPSKLDQSHTARQRELIDDLARQHLGRQLRGDKYSDIRILQRLLDSKVVDAQDTAKLQAMGVVLGDVLAKELDLNWVIFEDKNGRNRALRYRQLETVLFPITMISRRAEVGSKVDVQALFDKAVESYQPLLPPLPYSNFK